MNLTVRRRLAFLAVLTLMLSVGYAHAQGVTTGSITGVVTDPQKQAVPGATVVALHEPSGTRYEATSRPDGPGRGRVSGSSGIDTPECHSWGRQGRRRAGILFRRPLARQRSNEPWRDEGQPGYDPAFRGETA